MIIISHKTEQKMPFYLACLRIDTGSTSIHNAKAAVSNH
jgi:hypothetical protein